MAKQENDIPSIDLSEVLQKENILRYIREELHIKLFEDQSKWEHITAMILGFMVTIASYFLFLAAAGLWEQANGPPEELDAIQARNIGLIVAGTVCGAYWGVIFILQKGGPTINLLYAIMMILSPTFAHPLIHPAGFKIDFRRTGELGPQLFDTFVATIGLIIAYNVVKWLFRSWGFRHPEFREQWNENYPHGDYWTEEGKV